jgi:hypothetical protein
LRDRIPQRLSGLGIIVCDPTHRRDQLPSGARR